MTTQTKLENASIYTQVDDVDPLGGSYVYNFTTTSNTSSASAGRKLLAPAAASEAPTLYALPIGQKLNYQYVSDPLSDFEPTPEEEASPEAESPEEAPTEEEYAPEEAPSEEESTPEEEASPGAASGASPATSAAVGTITTTYSPST